MDKDKLRELRDALVIVTNLLTEIVDEPLWMGLVKKGDYILAIKQYRHDTGCDLKTAKTVIDDYRGDLILKGKI